MWSPSAESARIDVAARLDGLEYDVRQIVQRTEELHGQVHAGSGFITDAQALQRYEESLVAYMLEDLNVAASGFFSLVTTGALLGIGLHHEAEWYLAECLFTLGNLTSAEGQYIGIIENDDHPLRADGVRRLLEIYALTGRSEEFAKHYQREIVQGRVKPTDLITYSVAKGFFIQGDYVKAKSNFLELNEESKFYRKALYFLGAVMVAEANLEEAIPYFEKLATLKVEGVGVENQLRDLSLLALGRLNYELGDFSKAAVYYSEISGDSSYLADKLYELVWAFIKQEEYREALQGVEIFLLGFPQHQYTAQMKLLEGHLHLQQVEYDSALISYENVVRDYLPIREKLADFSRSEEVAERYFAEVLGEFEVGGQVGEALPHYALTMLRHDEDLVRGVSLQRDLQQQGISIAQSNELIAALDGILGNVEAIGGFDQLRYDVVLYRSLAVEQKRRLLSEEVSWLRQTSASAVRRELDAFQKQISGVVVDAGDEEGLKSLQALIDKSKTYRSQSSAKNRDLVAARFDGLHTELDFSWKRLMDVQGRLGDFEEAEIGRIRGRFSHEVQQVSEQDVSLDEIGEVGDRLASHVTQSAFFRLSGVFANSILRADMGIVDVYWAQKLEAADKKQQIAQDKNTVLGEMEQRFQFIRQKLGQ